MDLGAATRIREGRARPNSGVDEPFGSSKAEGGDPSRVVEHGQRRKVQPAAKRPRFAAGWGGIRSKVVMDAG